MKRQSQQQIDAANADSERREAEWAADAATARAATARAFRANLPGRATHAPGMRPSTVSAPLCGAPVGARLTAHPLDSDCQRCLARLARNGYQCPCSFDAIPCASCSARKMREKLERLELRSAADALNALPAGALDRAIAAVAKPAKVPPCFRPARTEMAELRLLVRNFGDCNESFLDGFTVPELVRLHRAMIASGWDILPDRWTARQVKEALRGIVPTWGDDEKPTYQASALRSMGTTKALASRGR